MAALRTLRRRRAEEGVSADPGVQPRKHRGPAAAVAAGIAGRLARLRDRRAARALTTGTAGSRPHALMPGRLEAAVARPAREALQRLEHHHVGGRGDRSAGDGRQGKQEGREEGPHGCILASGCRRERPITDGPDHPAPACSSDNSHRAIEAGRNASEESVRDGHAGSHGRNGPKPSRFSRARCRRAAATPVAWVSPPG